VTIHRVPQPGAIAAAFIAGSFEAVYETRLGAMTAIDLLQEYETVCAAFYAGDTSKLSCERVRLTRRVMARRLFASPS
jgi:hypothetical protein